MRLFNKKPAPGLPETSYQDVVDYLVALGQPDYTKIIKVVNIYRNADKDVKKVLNIKEKPADAEGFTDDELDDLFLLDEPKKQPKPKGKKITVKE